MTEHSEVLNDRPKIKVKLTRDSVCAGDDCDAPHEKTIEVYSLTDPSAFVSQFAAGYLPSVAGYGHSWTFSLNGKPISAITTTSIEPKVSTIQFEDENTGYFEYHSATF